MGVKIAICIPVHGDTKALFTLALAEMLVATMAADIQVKGETVKPDVRVFMARTSTLPYNRHKLLADSAAWGADFFLWLDADHTFPADTLLRLMSHGLAVVGANYRARGGEGKPTATRILDGTRLPVETTAEGAAKCGLERVDGLGLGVCLMTMTAIKALVAHREATGAMQTPIFESRMRFPDPATIELVTEDTFFLEQLAAAGVQFHVDHSLSLQVGHIGEAVRRF